ncbi:MAG: peptidoglycan-associated lipoprotein Pal [Gemmatimonadota bacterium]
MIVRRFAVPVLAATLLLAACKKEPPPPPPAPTGPTAEELAKRRADSIAAARAEAERRAAEERARAEAHRRAVEAARATLEEMVFFDYDKSDIRDDAAAVLRRKVDVLRASPQVQLRIEGHADERGSTEYNLALGSRRAEAVKQFLVGFGLSEGRFSTVSYGEERPLVDGHDEAAWAKNRRAEFVITAGANAINPPN